MNRPLINEPQVLQAGHSVGALLAAPGFAFDLVFVGAAFRLPRAAKGRAPASCSNLAGPCRPSARSTLSVPRKFLRGQESRGIVSTVASALSSSSEAPVSLRAGFNFPGVLEAGASTHIPRTSHKHPFLIAWLIARQNQCRTAATIQRFNEIQFSNRSYIVSFGGPFSAPVFRSNLHQISTPAHFSAQMEGAVN